MDWEKVNSYEFMRKAFKEFLRQHLQEHHKETPVDPMTEYAEDMGAPAKSEVCECGTWMTHHTWLSNLNAKFCPWCGKNLKGGG